MNEIMLQNLVENFIQFGIKAYKIQWRNTSDGRKLDRHEYVQIDDEISVHTWRELAVFQMAKFLKEEGLCNTEVTLNGNDSDITLQFENDSELKFCICRIKSFFEENKLEV